MFSCLAPVPSPCSCLELVLCKKRDDPVDAVLVIIDAGAAAASTEGFDSNEEILFCIVDALFKFPYSRKT